MGIRTYKPTSPGRRNSSVSDFAELTDKNKKPEKSLTEPHKKTGGRNNQGFITARHRGGGHKRKYRIIDWAQRSRRQLATVAHIEYDPNRSARIALVKYEDGQKHYFLAPDGLKAGMVVSSGPDAEPKLGNCLPLSRIPTGLTIHNIEMQPGGGGKLCRSAGVGAVLTAREGDLGPDHAALGRNAPYPGGLSGLHRHGRQPGSYERAARQGRAGAVVGPPAPRPRRRHEPGRSPDGWRRRADLRRPASLLAHRQARQGRQDPSSSQALEQGNYPSSP